MFQKILVQTFRFLDFLTKPRLTNVQRCQALFTISFLGTALYFPEMVLAQALGTGAGQQNNAQCSTGIWFLRDLNTYIASTLSGLGGADEVVCQIVNIIMLLSLVAVVGMIGWATSDHMGHGTPLKKAFEPFTGWLLGIMVIWAVIGIFFFGTTVGNAGSNAVQPGVQP